MKPILLLVCLTAACASADTKLKNAGSVVGNVTSLDCTVDGGLVCGRANGTAQGDLSCTRATYTQPGCLGAGVQTMPAGTKFFNSDVIVDGGLTSNSTISGNSLVARSGFIFGNTRADGGVSYIETDDPTGMIGFPSSPGIYLKNLTSIAQVGHLSGYLPPNAPVATFDATVTFTGSTFVAPAQFLRLSAMVFLTGFGDGGTNHDAGASQTMRLQVYDTTTTAVLCEQEVACNVSTGITGLACATDAGAKVTAADVIHLRVDHANCWQYPTMNVSAEYGGTQ